VTDVVNELSSMIFRYCELFGTAEFDAFALQFEHGEWHRAGPGAAAARAWIADNVYLYDGLPRTKHMTTNLVVDVAADGATATASSYVTVVQALPDFPLQLIFAGRYHDRFTRADGAWRWRREVAGDLYGDITRHVKSSRGPRRPSPGHNLVAGLQRRYP
jgi:hypothetical protein